MKIEPKNTSSSSFNSFKPDCDHLHLLNTEFPRSIVSDPLSVKDSLRSLPQSFQQFIFNSNNKNSSSVVGRRYRKRIRRKKQRRRRLPLSIFEDEDDEAEIPVGKNATDQKYCPKKKNDDEKWESPENLGQLAERLQMFFVDSKDRLKSALKTLEVLASFSNHQNCNYLKNY